MLCTLGTGRLWKRTLRLGRSILEPWPVGGRVVHAGTVLTARGDEVLRAVVGGGVAVVLMDARREVAVMTHLLIAASEDDGGAGAHQLETVLAGALQTAVEQGARPGFVRAKLFGAAQAVQPGVAGGRGVVRRVEHFLADRSVPADEMDVGGREYRQVAVRPAGGAVWCDGLEAPPRAGGTLAERAPSGLWVPPGEALVDAAAGTPGGASGPPAASWVVEEEGAR